MMNRVIKLDRQVPSLLMSLKGKDAIATGLLVNGAGTLSVCLVTFYKEGDPHPHSTELFFYAPGYSPSKQLPPWKPYFNISEYDYCKFEILSGSIHPTDEIHLSYRLTADRDTRN